MSAANGQFVMRPMSKDDIETVAVWLQDIDDLSLFDRTLTIPPGIEAIRESWNPDLGGGKFPTAYWFIVENAETGAVAVGGLLSINYVHGDAVLPILVARPARGLGLGLRIAAVMLDLAFDRLRLRRVTTFFRSDNARTEHMTRKVGFREEGRLRQAWFADGQHLDTLVVGILREEWYQRRETLRGEMDDRVVVALGRTEPGSLVWPSARAAILPLR